MAYNFEKLSVLIVDDNGPMRELVASMFAVFGCDHIDEAENGEQAFDLFCEHKHDLIISDWRMEPIDGLALLNMVRNHANTPNPYTPFIMMSGYREVRKVMLARDTGITEYITKPFAARDIYKRVENVIENPRRFVRADKFFGPDRRRKRGKNYDGNYKRETDVRPQDYRKDITVDFHDAY